MGIHQNKQLSSHNLEANIWVLNTAQTPLASIKPGTSGSQLNLGLELNVHISDEG